MKIKLQIPAGLKPIESFEGFYYISEDAFVYSIHEEKDSEYFGFILKPFISNTGYKIVTLQYESGVQKKCSIHRLVATAFIPNPENKPEVNHIDGDKLNNHVSNLQWCTSAENKIHYNKIKTVCTKRKAVFI